MGIRQARFQTYAPSFPLRCRDVFLDPRPDSCAVETRARFPVWRAVFAISSASAPDSTLKKRISDSSAKRISSTVFPGPSNTTLSPEPPGAKNSKQLSTGNNFETGAPFSQSSDDAQIGIGFDGIAHQMRNLSKGVVKSCICRRIAASL